MAKTVNRQKACGIAILALPLFLSSCGDPYSPGQRAGNGALIGGGTGAAIGALAGGGRGAAIGALAGGLLGAGTGALTTPNRPGGGYTQGYQQPQAVSPQQQYQTQQRYQQSGYQGGYNGVSQQGTTNYPRTYGGYPAGYAPQQGY
ncbi:YMGG-like glycine zipper-containing protein [Acetobacter sp.]|jgi:hypothetical protein|uniref:YMGG-like glycine zipper-containing protein n=1 Tax=Acetobacter sp. TaxID=440 RepID=UPI0025B907E0|nr:YMGG-like glycine zipper-containing protein [Acetobacter sp.]MCH4089958.1 hypothetical protein [Acetobacter sp.]MCI1298654.1 hypothetical protein [Acetobacter sp.]MCI1315219.1 hypothetical protein [Acetobacter sp.]